MATHEVTNVPPLWSGVNVFGADQALADRLVGTEPNARLKALGALAGSAQAAEWSRQANTYTPVLRTHDRLGRRIDEVEFHPAWHELMTVAVEHGLHGAPWASDSPAAHLMRAVGFFV
ncbi:MAG TPA: DNA alkylation response protein, partial [Jatrophihabitantaceae bacterium]|nr:DNA alkylation response protein [Jatrophihabitantaceae bacterium]